MISPQLVKELREKTGAGMMDCKKALEKNGGNLDAAVEHLRKQGLQAASQKAARVASEGLVQTYVSPDEKWGVLVEVNCETDFVAKNEEFIAFVSSLASLIGEKNPSSLDTLLSLPYRNSQTVSERLNELVSRIGEKLNIRRFERKGVNAGEQIGAYVHLGSKIAVLVTLQGPKATGLVAKDIAMHVAALHPLYLDRSHIPADILEKEKEILRVQIKDSGKPKEIMEKIVEGKISKFAMEVCLNEQVFVKDPTGKKTVAKLLQEMDPLLKVASFIRYQVGEGLEKRNDDFASEVAKMVQ